MGALRWASLVILFAAAAPALAAAADPVDRWKEHVAEASRRFDMPSDWIRRVMSAESGGRTLLNGRPIESYAGALGLMQLMPATWREMRTRLALGPDPHHPRDNIIAGTAYLRLMYERFGYPGLFAAYNAGPARYAAHLATGRRLPAETVAYVARLRGALGTQTGVPVREARPFSLFIRLSSGRAPVGEVSADVQAPAPNSLFVKVGVASALP